MKTYRHIFFDLDHTLWDFERNAVETLNEIYEEAHLQSLGLTADVFIKGFQATNEIMWHLFDTHQITQAELRTTRFKRALNQVEVEIDDKLSENLNELFLTFLPRKGHVVQGTMELLDYLSERYPLHLITNGFHETQGRKMRSAGIEHYFQEIINSENAKARKPEKAIFDFALNLTGATAEESLMIGDNCDTDIKGAIDSGIDTVYFNPEKRLSNYIPTYEIQHLLELKDIL